MNATELAAWVGATSGLAGLFWNIYAKITAGPKLAVSAFANMVQMPAQPGNPRFLRITVRNIGTTTTTLTNVDFFAVAPRWKRFLWWARLEKRPAETRAVLNHYQGLQLPQRLEVGSEWQALMQQDDGFEQWLTTTQLCCAIWHSFSKRPVPTRIVRAAP
jgi:hypothetical protein